MAFQKNDFLELDYKGKTEDGKIFDTNIKEEAEKLEIDRVASISVICLGQNMIMKPIDEFLLGKEPGKYTLNLEPEKAFGLRQPSLVKIMPMAIFQKQQVYPQPGMVFSFDNALGKVSTVSGGRVIVDFNNPLASKRIVYELNVKRKIESVEEKVKALMQAFFQTQLPFKIEEKKLIIESKNNFSKFVIIFKQKFKEILDLDLEAVEVADKKEDELKSKEQNLTSSQ
ncbi:MAG: peptidylprolyl isomerase [Candidatus Pacearchaeota archaeon]|nr:peptidylprolyl isomerase [Candidatus Pacearchaeota archaeon]